MEEIQESVDQAAPAETWRFAFFGKGSTLFGIYIVNLFLILITLGIYYFWAKVRIRKYLWGQADFDGDRFSYHGTGKESLLGWLKAFLIFILPCLLLQNLPIMLGMRGLMPLAGLLAVILIYLFIPFAMVGTRRYRLSRTAWRGIRFSFRGHWRECGKILLIGGILMGLTLGLYYPYFKMKMSSFFLSNTWFGNGRFAFNGKGGDLFGKFIIALLLAIPTLFISLIWFSYKKTVYVWNHTTFEQAAFKTDVTFGGVLFLYLTNVVVLIVTLGFGFPWVTTRTVRYYLSHLKLEGHVDFQSIVQEARDSTALGDELGGFWDVGFDLG